MTAILVAITVAVSSPQTINIKQAVQIALKNNPTVKAKIFNLQKAQAQLMEAKLNYYIPSLTFSGTYTRLDPDTVDKGKMKTVSFTTTPMGMTPVTKEIQTVFADNWSFSFSLSKPIFTGFALQTAVDIAEKQVEMAQIELEKARTDIEYQVKTAFYQYLLAKELLKTALETQKELEEHLAYSKASYEAGKVSEYDLLRSQTQVEANKPSIASAEKNLKILEQRLKTLIGIPLTNEVEFEGELKLPKYRKISKSEVELLALKNNPDIKKLITATDISKLSIAIAKSGKYPTVAVFGSYGWDYKKENMYSEGDRKFVGSGSVGVQVQINLSSLIPEYSTTDQKIKQAENDLKSAEENLTFLKEQIKLKAESLVLSVKEAELNIQSQSSALKLAQKGLEMARERYQTGRMSNVDLIDAEVSWTRARVGYLQAVFQLLTSLMELEKLTGIKIIVEEDNE